MDVQVKLITYLALIIISFEFDQINEIIDVFQFLVFHIHFLNKSNV